MRAAEMLGFNRKQYETGWLTPWLGNTYSGASPMGLTAILDVAKPGDKIFMVSYGSGAGSDGFVYTVTDAIKGKARLAPNDAAAAGREQGTTSITERMPSSVAKSKWRGNRPPESDR